MGVALSELPDDRIDEVQVVARKRAGKSVGAVVVNATCRRGPDRSRERGLW